MIKWYPELTENVGNVPKIFLRNKIDLREEYQMMKKRSKRSANCEIECSKNN